MGFTYYHKLICLFAPVYVYDMCVDSTNMIVLFRILLESRGEKNEEIKSKGESIYIIICNSL